MSGSLHTGVLKVTGKSTHQSTVLWTARPLCSLLDSSSSASLSKQFTTTTVLRNDNAMYLSSQPTRVYCNVAGQYSITTSITTSTALLTLGNCTTQITLVQPSGTTVFNIGSSPLLQTSTTYACTHNALIAAGSYFTVKFNSTLLATQSQGSIMCCLLAWV
jgi:hypothetical protein